MVTVEDVLADAAVANLVVHVDDGAEGADLVELGRRERGLVAGEQLVNPVGALVGLHDAAMRQLDLLVQTLKLDALVLHGGFPSLAVACALIIPTYHAINVAYYNPTYPLHEKGHPPGCPFQLSHFICNSRQKAYSGTSSVIAARNPDVYPTISSNP